MTVHPMAVVDPGAEVHEEALVGPFCVVGAGARLDAGVELRNHVTVTGRCSIGAGTVVHPGAVLGGDPQDLKFQGEDSEVRIGRDCRIHECTTINKGTVHGGMLTSLGDGCLVMAYAHVAHDCRLGNRVIIGNNAQLAGHVIVEDRAVVSGMVGVHHFVSIGELSFIGAMSGVRQDVPPFVTADGRPAEPRSINVVGLRRADWPIEEIRATKDAFRALYQNRNGTPMSEVLERVRIGDAGKCRPVVRLCQWMNAHLTNSMAQIEGDFEKGEAFGSLEMLELITQCVKKLR